MTKEYTFDIEDDFQDYEDKYGRHQGDALRRTGTVESEVSQAKIARFVETCRACNGSGRFYSNISGRLVGDCFKCKGTGKVSFKTSPETRQRQREGAQDRKKAAISKVHARAIAWSEDPANAERWAFMNDNQDWEFMRSLAVGLFKYGSLTEKQVAAIDKAIASRRQKRALDSREDTGLDLSEVPSGRYLVDDHQFRIDNVEDGKWAGWVFVKDPDADSRVGSQRPGNSYRGQHVDLLIRLAEDPLAAAVAFGRATGHCCICGRLLTNPESVEAGIGPICAGRF